MPTTTETNLHKVTEIVIQELKSDRVKHWARPWIIIPDLPVNFNNETYKNPVNNFMLSLKQRDKQYKSINWLTFNRGKRLGGIVRAGESATSVYGWFPIWTLTSPDGKKQTFRTDPKNKKAKKFLAYSARSMFNVDQFYWEEGIPDIFKHDSYANKEIESSMVKQAVHAYVEPYLLKHKIELVHFGNQAYYDPLSDRIFMPPVEHFKNPTGYATTLLHETIHSTGHKSRLKRDSIATRRTTERYSKEELIAELGAAMISHELGLPFDKEDMASSVDYIRGWASTLEGDKNMFTDADKNARKARTLIEEQIKDEKDLKDLNKILSQVGNKVNWSNNE